MSRTLILLTLVLGFAACGATAREKTIKATLITANVARDEFASWDLKHQHALVETSSSKDDATEKVAHYRKDQDRVVLGFTALYRLIATAAILEDDPKSLANLLAAADQLYTLITEIKR